jgi:hypothetical protein
MRRAVLLLAAVLCVSACTVWPVGQDPYGMNLRREANQTIMALQSYHRDHGAFPDSLASLTPQYLPTPPDVPTLHYEPGDGSLSYKYTPSWPQLRPVWCRSAGNATDWICEEHLL